MKLREFSELVQGIILGDPETKISGVAGIRDAKQGDITFLTSPKYQKYLEGNKASCLIVREPIKGIGIPQLKVSNPAYVFAKAIEHFYPRQTVAPHISKDASVSDKTRISINVTVLPFAFISDNVVIGEGTIISPGAFIGENSKIGKHCIIYPNVTVRENVTIGDRVIIHSGSVIGSDGFGYILEKGEHYKIPQVGEVIIGDDVEIGSNVSIDRATLGSTVIGSGTKIDNLVQIAHNVKIGERSLIIAQVGIAGSSELGSYVTLAGQVGVADHTRVASGTIAVAKTGLMGDIEKGIYGGTFPIPHREWLKAQALYAKLPEMHKRIKDLEEKIKTFEKGNQNDDRK